MAGGRISLVLMALLVLTAALPLAEAQGGGGQRRVTITFIEPETAAKNKTLELQNGSAEAKLTVRYMMGGGGGGGGFFTLCQPGTRMTIPLVLENVPAGMHATIEPAAGTYDVGATPPPPAGQQPNRVTTHTLKVHFPVANLTAPLLIPINVTHKPGTVSGGQCAPMTPNTGNTPGKATLNITAPYVAPKAAPKTTVVEEGFLPTPGFVVVLLALVGVMLFARRLQRA